MKTFENFQELGKALILPVILLPIAAIFTRVGGDIFHINVIKVAGTTISDNLTHLFAVAVGIGLSKDKSGVAGFSALVANFIIIACAKSINPSINMGVFSGILSGYLASVLYNRYHQKSLPETFAYFSGKRYVPIMTTIWAIAVGTLVGILWPHMQKFIDTMGNSASHSSMGPFLFGFFNRLLIPLGLHQVINSIFFHQLGSFTPPNGQVVTGDYFRFLAGDPTAGVFLSGFYPIMMFGIPGALFAMYVSAKQENKKEISGLLLTMAFTSIITGITEPFEFSFMFLSPLLFIIHAFLVGLSLMVTNYFGVLFGFSFSGGLIDFLVNFSKSTNGLLIIPIGLAFGIVYFFIFYYLINILNLKTLGREDFPLFQFYKRDKKVLKNENSEFEELAKNLIIALGGKNNIIEVGSCSTRLLLTLKNRSLIDIQEIRELGSKGIIKTADNTLQLIFDSNSKVVAKEMQNFINKT